ncbi:MAG TPA: RhuM family protein, partial [Micropepsaceae bacterium]|nr:RhuM family protein [Micropepsaceae bacterium]
QIAELFGVDRSVVTKHLLNAYEDGELDPMATCAKIAQVRQEGGRAVTRQIEQYNLDAIISVGYRVSSKQGTIFRRWATGVLVQIAVKGFVVDVERLKNPEENDRVAELREIIRDIRASEANMYAELRRICAMCRDYEPQSESAREFYQYMQAKLFWAVTSRTPSMIITERADATAPNMGLCAWPKSEIRKQDVLVAKNYLNQTEIKELNRLTDILLSIFEDQLDIGKLTLMTEASALLDQQLRNLNRSVLRHGGTVKHSTAERVAKAAYTKFDKARRELRRIEAEHELAQLKATGKELPKSKRKRPA